MEVMILDQSFRLIDYVDAFESLIWAERFNAYGDFEIYAKFSSKLLNSIRPDYYARIKESDRTMIIEDIAIDTSIEDGSYLKISGRSLESILTRRIVWEQTILSSNFQNAVKKLLNDNIISPKVSGRRIENFVFEPSTDPSITSLLIDAQCEIGEDLYETIVSLCDSQRIGFRVTLNANNQFVFKLIPSIDRSYYQESNPYVIFSPEFDNLMSSNYSMSYQSFKNVALVVGEEPEEGESRKTRTVGTASGLGRREIFTDASNLKSKTDDDIVLTASEYNAQLDLRGYEDLYSHQATRDFEAEVDTSRMYFYGKDFFIGDIVQFVNEHGIGGRARITEFIRNQDSSGYKEYPSFVMLDEMEE